MPDPEQTSEDQTPEQPISRPFRRIYHKTLGKGSLMNCQYLFFKHDPYPLVLVTGIRHDGKVAGLNLHYLTYRYVKKLLQMYCGNMAFSYLAIKHDSHIVNSFRTYKRNGIRGINLLDCDFLLNVLGSVRSFSPNEVEKIKESIKEQLQQRINPTAREVSEKYHQMVNPQQDFGVSRPDARRVPSLGTVGPIEPER